MGICLLAVPINLLSILDQCHKVRDDFIEDFLHHVITQEILAGPTSLNSSGTLGGYGNLFSFIGFEKGQEPINDILNLLTPIQFDYFFSNKTEVSIYAKNFPSLDDIWNATPMPWSDGSGRSWAKGIESGISGLNHYLFLKTTSEKSRSTMAVQADRVRSNTRYTPQKYITDLLKGYKKRFQSLSKTDIKLF
jgi:hypothetical protein